MQLKTDEAELGQCPGEFLGLNPAGLGSSPGRRARRWARDMLSWERGHHRQFDTPQFYRGEAALGMIFPRDDLSRYSAFPKCLRDVEKLGESLSVGCWSGSGLDCWLGRWGGCSGKTLLLSSCLGRGSPRDTRGKQRGNETNSGVAELPAQRCGAFQGVL